MDIDFDPSIHSSDIVSEVNSFKHALKLVSE